MGQAVGADRRAGVTPGKCGLRFYERQTMEVTVIIHGLEEWFVSFAGVPTEILFDLMKAAALANGRSSGGDLVERPVRYASRGLLLWPGLSCKRQPQRAGAAIAQLGGLLAGRGGIAVKAPSPKRPIAAQLADRLRFQLPALDPAAASHGAVDGPSTRPHPRRRMPREPKRGANREASPLHFRFRKCAFFDAH